MAFLTGLLDKIKTKKKQLELSKADQYLQMIRAIASNEEVDADEVAELLDAIGKSESAFQSDVETMAQRCVEASQLHEKEAIARSIPKLSRNLDVANEALAEANARLQPAIAVAYQQLKDAETKLLSFHGIESRLVSTCMDQSLLTRERELLNKRSELMSKRAPLSEDLRNAQAIVQNHESTIEGLRAKAKVNPNWNTEQRDIREKVSKHAESIPHYKSTVAQLEAAIAKIDDEISPINQELADIAKQKLVP